MGDEVRLTAEERGWFDSWRDRCDEDPALQRHEGYIEMAADILRYRVQAARAEDAARLAEVERAFAGIRCALLHWQAEGVTRGVSCANCQSWAKSIAMPFFTARTTAALGVTAPTASEAGDERDQACVDRWPGCEIGAYDPRCCRWPKSCSCYPAPAEASEVEGSGS